MNGISSTPTATSYALRWWRRRVVLIPLFSVYLVLLAYLGFRLFLYLRYDVSPVTHTSTLDGYQLIYPELFKSGVLDILQDDSDTTCDVVLIGGSTLEQTADEIEKQLRYAWGDDVRVYNLAKAAHTSRDTLFKFRKLPERGIDLVVLYDGFNDIRMNCVPTADFKGDYTHCNWYVDMERRLQKRGTGMQELVTRDLKAIGTLIDLGQPSDEWLDEGATVKSTEPFRENIAAILRTCRDRNIPVVLMTFPWYLPSNYTAEKLANGELDYGKGAYRMHAESWGRPENINRTMTAHNEVIHELAAEPEFASTVRFVDQVELLSASGTHFSDPCHFTPAGIERFAKNLAEKVERP
ncbi:MAG: SGNH/GDSL hydrolase family protein [Planctomycetota bacterium]|nr:SGNH/GDSL hydrolase family protein [Planctomycetota bacterium]MDA1213138.1 SGNH/GDSL hydrolase family protein [Planctomycetota bacterium]